MSTIDDLKYNGASVGKMQSTEESIEQQKGLLTIKRKARVTTDCHQMIRRSEERR